MTDIEADLMIANAEIKQLQARLEAAISGQETLQNELCLKCGRYHEAHKGACDGCRWKE